MNRVMNEHDDPIVRRLGELGRTPVDPAVASAHLTAMARVPPWRMLGTRLRVGGAFAVGLLMGTTGLATAGALPAPVQQIAHTTRGAVGVDVPGADRTGGPECGDAKNHGQYVRQAAKGARADAAHSDCGKPVSAVSGDGKTTDTTTTAGPTGAGATPAPDCQGPPPWAKQGITDKAAKTDAQHAWQAACGDDGDHPEKASGAPTTTAGDDQDSDAGHEGDGPPQSTPGDDHRPAPGTPGGDHSNSGGASGKSGESGKADSGS